MKTDFRTKALMDNSAFAGVLRIYCPDVEMHDKFLRQYPEHREIDERSLADFLTAIVIYDRIYLDSSSIRGTITWTEQLLSLLPQDIRELVIVADFELAEYTCATPIGEYESCRKAFDIMCSPLKDEIALSPEEEIPKVYYANDYVYRRTFDALNREAGRDRLDTHALAQAKYLHRGLFLQSRAHGLKCVYMPYHYRGKMLSRLPPLVWAESPFGENLHARLPLAKGLRPDETSYVHAMNEYYYSLLEIVSWTTYDQDVPFIGAAVLSAAKGDPQTAFRKALELRQQGGLRREFMKLQSALDRRDRPTFESLMKRYQSELAAAARHLGADLETPQTKAFYKLATFWLPSSVKAAIDAAVELLPVTARDWGRRTASKLLIKSNPFQLLFLEHAAVLKSI